MKKLLLFLLPFILTIPQAFAQITVNQNDFANAGDVVYINTANIPLGINFSATGPNRTWNFSQLRNNGQEEVTFRTVASTGVVYSLYYLNIFLNPNRANMALDGTDIAFAGVLGVDNPYTFYFKDNNQFRKVGYGGEILGAPIPIALNNNDIIYRFPMNFGNSHTSDSDYDISVPGLPDVSYEQTRQSVVDGWGTLTTPYGTFDVLKVKSVIESRDIIAGLTIPRPRRTEYKWIAKNEDIPILQINTTTILGIETVNEILFKDNKMNIVVNNLTGTLCPGSSATVTYTKSGTYNPSAFLQSGNQFRVQLSNANGSFASPVQIGSLNSTTSGTINVTIPANTPPGSGYKIRIVSTSPQVIGEEYGPFTIPPIPTASITAGGPTTVCTGQTVLLTANSGPFNYQWNLNGSAIAGATAQTYVADATGNYTVSVSNVCGTVTSAATVVTVRPDPVHTLVPSTLATCDGSPIQVSSDFVSGVSPFTFQWFVDGNIIAGATASNYTVRETGDYSLLITDNIGCSFQTPPLSLIIDSVDIPVIQPSGGSLIINDYALICPGSNVLLQTDEIPGYFYQWQLNGADIPGAENYFYFASVGGNYTVLVGDSCDSEMSDTIRVLTLALPVQFVEASQLTSCDGNPITLSSANASAASPVTYQWHFNGQPIPGANDTFYDATTTGNYYLEVSDNFGCTFGSESFDLVFSPALDIEIFASGGTSFCPGDSVILFTDDFNVNYNYQWYVDSAAIVGETSVSIFASEGGEYYLAVSYGSQCESFSNVVEVTNYPTPPAPVVSQSQDTLFSSSASDFQWFFNGNPISGANDGFLVPEESGTYTVVISDSLGCTNSTEVFYFRYVEINSISNQGASWEISLSPNPMNDRFTVQSAEPLKELYMYNMTGALVHSAIMDYPATDYTVVKDNLQSGVYFVRIVSGNGAQAVLKVVKAN
jgi:hypothetical protein